MAFPQTRMRRLRATAGLRGLVRETELSAGRLVLPLFVVDSSSTKPAREPIATMPGVDRLSVSAAVAEAREAAALGIGAVMLFGVPAEKDEHGSGAWDEEGVVQVATRAIKQAQPGAARRHRRVPVRVHRPRALRSAARRTLAHPPWTTTRPSSCSGAPPSATRAPAPTWWRPRT